MSFLLEIGQDFTNKYTVEKILGAGSYSEVYLVKHKHLGEQALKVFKQSVNDPQELEALLEEARIPQRFHNNQHIVRVYDAGTVRRFSGYLGYFTMEYFPGGSLQNFLDSHKDIRSTKWALSFESNFYRRR